MNDVLQQLFNQLDKVDKEIDNLEDMREEILNRIDKEKEVKAAS